MFFRHFKICRNSISVRKEQLLCRMNRIPLWCEVRNQLRGLFIYYLPQLPSSPCAVPSLKSRKILHFWLDFLFVCSILLK